MTARASARLVVLALLLGGCPKPVVHAPPEPPPHVEPDLVGVEHVVKPGETLWRIARAYGTDVETLAAANHLGDATQLEVGQKLFVPGAAKVASVSPPPADEPEPKPAKVVVDEKPARFQWPLVGVLYARFGPRADSRHDGIDIAAPLGSEVRAAGEGTVIFSGEQKGYGNLVIVRHDDGLLTLYAGNERNLAKDGERVKAGEVIARVGESSRTSGPHLHFEVRDGTAVKDPMKFLPRPR